MLFKRKTLRNPTKHDEWGLGKLTEDEANTILNLRQTKRVPKTAVYRSICSVCSKPFEVEHPVGTHVTPGLMGRLAGVEWRFMDWHGSVGTSFDCCTPCLKDIFHQLSTSGTERLIVQ